MCGHLEAARWQRRFPECTVVWPPADTADVTRRDVLEAGFGLQARDMGRRVNARVVRGRQLRDMGLADVDHVNNA